MVSGTLTPSASQAPSAWPGGHLVCIQDETQVQQCQCPTGFRAVLSVPRLKFRFLLPKQNCWFKILIGKSDQNPTTLSRLILPVTSAENNLILKLNSSKLLVITFQVFILLREGGEENQAI